MDLYWKLLSAPLGSGEELLLSSPEPKFPMDWSRDGRFLLYTTIYPNQGLNISVLPLDGDRTHATSFGPTSRSGCHSSLPTVSGLRMSLTRRGDLK